MYDPRYIPTIVRSFCPVHPKSQQYRTANRKNSSAISAGMLASIGQGKIGGKDSSIGGMASLMMAGVNTRRTMQVQLELQLQRAALKKAQQLAKEGVRVCEVSCGSAHTAVVSVDDRAVYTWGDGGE